MNILFTIWKDISHPDARSTENTLWDHMKQLEQNGHNVFVLCSWYQWCVKEEEIDGINIRRYADIHTLYFKIWRHYSEHYKHKFDIIINECWWAPLLLPRYERVTPMLLFINFKNDAEWDQEFKYPLSNIGRFICNRVISMYNMHPVICTSEEVKNGLVEGNGFRNEKVHIIENPVQLEKIFGAYIKKNTPDS